MLLLRQQPGSDTLGLARHDPALIGAAVLKQLPVQRLKIRRHRHRNPVVAAEVAYLALHAALLMAFTRGAELGLILPVGAERDEPCRQFALLAAQNLLHRARQVIVAKHAKDALEVSERQLVSLQKWISPMEARSPGHRPHPADLKLDPLPVQTT